MAGSSSEYYQLADWEKYAGNVQFILNVDCAASSLPLMFWLASCGNVIHVMEQQHIPPKTSWGVIGIFAIIIYHS